MNRSQCLRLLGYPELALGDIYKARLLIEAALEKRSVLGKYKNSSIPMDLVELMNIALKGRVTLGEKAILTFGIKMYFQHTTDPAYAKWAQTVATPTLLENRAVAMLKRLEVQIWSELMDSLLACNACSDYVELSSEAVLKFENDPVFLSEYKNAEAWSKQRKEILEIQVEEGNMSPVTMNTTLSNGGYYPVPYPWMTEDLLIRDDECLAMLQKEFRMASPNSMVTRSMIRNTQFENGVELETEFDVFGVFASRNIMASETTLVDQTIACALNTTTRCPTCCGPMPVIYQENLPVTIPCCEKIYCSQTCAETAITKFHGPECGREKYLEEYYTEACKSTETTDFAIEHTLFLRIISNALTESASHPLKTSTLQRLTPSYSTEHLTIFNWMDHIVTPTNILTALNIDVFKNLDYDTWVLQTIRHRLQNNKHGVIFSSETNALGEKNNIVGSSMSPLYSMHNHSCTPNLTWEFLSGEASRHGDIKGDGRCSTLRMFANRDIERGEELTITYILPLDIDRAERNEKLLSWLGGECRCERCLKEKKAEEGREE